MESNNKLLKPGPTKLFPLVAVAVILSDQVTKSWIGAHMVPGQSIPERGLVFITYVRNSGAAFGLAVNPNIIIVLAIVVAVTAAAFFYTQRAFQTGWFGFSLGLMLGGAVGNLIDRFRFGYVIDFIDVRFWPVFNIADSAISVGVGMLAFYLLFMASRKKQD
ncbi:MAG: signal peptidase II [Dehalococcoidia bacterium]|nr:signal peptidase II [Dehalococcoidia bacterium]